MITFSRFLEKEVKQSILCPATFIHLQWFPLFSLSFLNVCFISFCGNCGLNKNRFHFFLLSPLFIYFFRFSDFKTVFAIFTFVQSGKRLDIPSDCPFKQLIENSWSQVFLLLKKLNSF